MDDKTRVPWIAAAVLVLLTASCTAADQYDPGSGGEVPACELDCAVAVDECGAVNDCSECWQDCEAYETDRDGDGVPDWHDPCPDGVTDEPPCDDPDGDGVPTLQDNCPDVANPDQADSNHDGVGDACPQSLGIGDWEIGRWWNNQPIVSCFGADKITAGLLWIECLWRCHDFPKQEDIDGRSYVRVLFRTGVEADSWFEYEREVRPIDPITICFGGQ